jgi:ATP-dependent helicase/DNAse subunit B
MSLETMISMFRQKFRMHEVFHIIKSLTYFEDAEQSANPVVFDKTVTWQKVKGSIKAAVKKLG